MATIFGENNEAIEIAFPSKKFSNYLKKLKVKELKELTPKQKQILFLTTIRDFKTGKLSLDELSDISGYVWHHSKGKTSELMQQLYHAGELNYYVRHIKGENDNFVQFMKEVMDYYEKYKGSTL